MSYLERAITDGHAKFSGEGKQQKILYVAVNHTEHYADPEEQVRAGFNLNPVVRMAARRHRRHKTKGLGRVDRCGLLHLSGEREFQIKTVIRVSVSAPFVLFCGKSTAAFKFCMTRRLWFLREIRRSEREANIIADLPRQYGKPEAGQKRTKAKGQTLNAKMNSTQSVSAFSLSQPRPARQPGGAHHAIKQCHQKQL